MKKEDIRKIIYKKNIFFDGAAGTNLHERGLKTGESPEMWNISNPKAVTELHSEYIAAGADIIKTNTFGAYSFKYANYAEIIKAAFKCAEEAVNQSGKTVYTAFDMGSTGKMLKPYGDTDFEDAVEYFAKSVREAVKYSPDFILIETMNDCLETKAAVIAAKENSDLPIFVTNTFDAGGKLLTGAGADTMAVMLESLGVDAIGINCGSGPDDGENLIKIYKKYCGLPIIANPNAGLPKTEKGRTFYDMSPDEFAKGMKKLYKAGASVIGGCCGTTPDHIRKTVETLKNEPFARPVKKRKTCVSSYTHIVEFGKKTVNIGERINPTGKPKLKAALRENNIDYLISEGLRQEEAGVDILDVNVGLPEINEAQMLKNVVFSLQAVCDLPLQLDSAKPEALEAAMRIYAGKPLINSINGKKSSMDDILPLVKKYGGSVIALTLDENGIPQTAEERVEIAKRILKYCEKYGIRKNDIIFDPLTMTISSGKDSAVVTLKAVSMLKKMGCRTSLGVSNVSFGLPKRELVNTIFIEKAQKAGLSAAIMNPFMKIPDNIDTEIVGKLLDGKDDNCLEYIKYAESLENSAEKQPDTTVICENSLKNDIISGLSNGASEKAAALLKTKQPLEIIDGEIVPALDICGKNFEEKKTFLPQLLMSAEAASAAFDVIKKAMEEKGRPASKGEVILATVKGDIHDIGKNIVKVLLESYGFTVRDLGRDVDADTIVKCAVQSGCRLVGLSALMTTTLPAMEETVKKLKQADPEIRTVVGGAVLTQEYASMIGADKYSAEAMETVKYALDFYGK